MVGKLLLSAMMTAGKMLLSGHAFCEKPRLNACARGGFDLASLREDHDMLRLTMKILKYYQCTSKAHGRVP